MSIFEPIPRESHWDDDEEADDEEDDFPAAGPFDPRSITIAGIVVAGLVVAGLVASNNRERQSPPLAPSVQVNPGAASVEQLDVTPTAQPTPAPTPSPSATPVETTGDNDTGDVGADRKHDGDDKPGKGNGRGRG